MCVEGCFFFFSGLMEQKADIYLGTQQNPVFPKSLQHVQFEGLFSRYGVIVHAPNKQRGLSAFHVFVWCLNKPSSCIPPLLFHLTDLIVATVSNAAPDYVHMSVKHGCLNIEYKFSYNKMPLFSAFSLGSPHTHTQSLSSISLL